MKEIEDIAKIISDINKEADLYPTNNKDYKMAQAGVENGEENYTEKERTIIKS
jgi:hypothetical protein